MTSIIGTWDVALEGVLGKGIATFEFTQGPTGIQCRISNDPNEPRVDRVHVNGNDVTLDIFVQKPAPSGSVGHLTLVDDNRFTGEAKRKYLPATHFVGTRRAS